MVKRRGVYSYKPRKRGGPFRSRAGAYNVLRKGMRRWKAKRMRGNGQGRYVRAPAKTTAGRLKATIKRIMLKQVETKRRGVRAVHGVGTAMVLTAGGQDDSRGANGLWLGSTAASVTLARPDNALIYPQNCVFGAIAKGDNSDEREGDKVDLIYIANPYWATITWGQSTETTQAQQRLNCLEFLLCITDPNAAAAMCIDMDTGGDDYQDVVMRILTAGGIFCQQYTLAEIQGSTPPANSLTAQTIWMKDNIFGLKQWNNDMSADDVSERTDVKGIGKVAWHKWHTYKRPHYNSTHVVEAFNVTEAAHDGGIPISTTTNNRVAVSEAGANDDLNEISSHLHAYAVQTTLQAHQRTRIKLGMKMHFKKPVKLIYNIATDGSETTASLAQNKTFIYGTWWISDMSDLGSVDIYRGSTEMRWKDP